MVRTNGTSVRRMAWLNYHHLYYFYRVARAGSLAAAARELHVTHSTLSVQVRELGEALGGALFEKEGRRLVLTPRGEEVLGYAEEIFQLGAELMDTASEPARDRARLPVRIGVVPGLPRSLVYRLLEPVLSPQDPSMVLRTDGYPHLLEELAVGKLHVVLADAPPTNSGPRSNIYAHPLGRSGLAFYASPPLARSLRAGFPRSMALAPLVLPTPGTALRRLIDRWLSAHHVRPKIAIEADDAALMRMLGARGHGVFPVREALRAEAEDVLGAERVGPLEGVVETYYAVSIERRVRHPFVSALVGSARDALDGE